MTDRIDPILDAIEHGEATGDGAEFTLRIAFASGKELEGVAVAYERDEFDVIASYRLVGNGDSADLFVNPALIEAVTIQW